MTECKFTDEQIIKALGCCANTLECRNCPLIDEDNCTYRNINYVLDLINRQRAEIERLTLHKNLIASENELHKIGASELVLQHRVEAIQEFAARLVSKVNCIPQHHFTLAQVLYDIDTLVKEMTGGK